MSEAEVAQQGVKRDREEPVSEEVGGDEAGPHPASNFFVPDEILPPFPPSLHPNPTPSYPSTTTSIFHIVPPALGNTLASPFPKP